MRSTFRIGSVWLLMSWAIHSPMVQAQEPNPVPSTPSIQVTGTAVHRVTPNKIVWTITTTDDDADLAVAKRASDQSAKRVNSLREELQLDASLLTAGRLSIERVYERDRQQNEREFKHFRVRRQYTLVQTDLNRFDEFLTRIVAGPVETQFVFEVSNFHALRAETRIRAVKLAQDKARAMAEALGVGIGRPLRVEEQTGTGMPWANFASNAVFESPAESPSDAVSGSLIPDAMEISVSVQVTFELTD